MGISKTYAVFGLGRYGLAAARTLAQSGAEVVAVDVDEAVVSAAALEIPFCKCADVTDAEVLKQLGIGGVDVVVIAMAGNLEASVLAIMLCKELGVKTVIAKCGSEMHGRILDRVGADRVVFPENESGMRLAKNLLSAGFIDVIELSKDVSVIELDVKPDWVGKTLVELKLRKRYAINIIAIRHADRLSIDIDPAMKLTGEMKLVVVANPAKLGKLK